MSTMSQSVRKLLRNVSWLLIVGLCTCYTFRSSQPDLPSSASVSSPIDTFHTDSTFVDITTSWDRAIGQHDCTAFALLPTALI